MMRIVILAGAASCTHSVSVRLARCLLEDAGYQVVDLGPATPLEEVAAAAKQNGASATVIASVNGLARIDLAGLPALRASGLLGMPVVFGGLPAVDGDPTGLAVQALRELGVVAVLQSLDELVPTLDALGQRPAERRNAASN